MGADDPQVEGLLDGPAHRRVAVAEERGAGPRVEVDVGLAVHVVEPPAFAPGDHERPPQGRVHARRRRHAAGEVALRFLVEPIGLAHDLGPFLDTCRYRKQSTVWSLTMPTACM